MPLEAVLRSNLQNQYNTERQNEVFYRAIEGTLRNLGLHGLAKWMHRAAKDERQHAQYIFDYILDRNEVPQLSKLEQYAPPMVNGQSGASALFAEALKREQQNTQAINYLYYLADEVKDPQTCTFLHWFIDEQTESEATLQDILAQLKIINDDAGALLRLDHRLAKHDHI